MSMHTCIFINDMINPRIVHYTACHGVLFASAWSARATRDRPRVNVTTSLVWSRAAPDILVSGGPKLGRSVWPPYANTLNNGGWTDMEVLQR